ncbi:MAG: glycosyltransferase family 1 protein [Clostridiaceae bacterium]|jgi:glycosyltransferase involved in cell wall biosynthesis|nr:glycosyltransferase family 1 protein [Clostridiaceae bacterium]
MKDPMQEYKDIKHLFEKRDICPPGNPINDLQWVVIYPPTIDWDYMRQRPQQLMEQFSLNEYEVFYCNKTQLTNKLFTEINSHLKIVHNNSCFIRDIVPELKRLGKKIILWVSWSKLHAFLDSYLPDFIVYDYLDDFEAWRPYLKSMIEKANIVITTSKILKEQMAEEYPDKPSIMVPNGCDIKRFRLPNSIGKPPELYSHEGPVITYSGAWASWIDVKLVERIAETFNHALICVIGTEFGIKVPAHHPNLKYLGQKTYSQLPEYLINSTICIIPFLINSITIATNPIKMYEYLASGKPVVSTNLPEAKNVPSVYIAKDHESFIERIKLILEGKAGFRDDETYVWLEEHTWEKRFEKINAFIKEYLPA